MQIPGFPFDIYSLFGFASTVFLVFLGLLHLINSNNSVQENVPPPPPPPPHADVDHQDQVPSTTTSATNTYICSFCGDGSRITTRCSRCKVARYCSGKCQIKHWSAGHKLECKDYKSHANEDSASAVSSGGISTSHVGISSSDHHRDRDQMPSTSASSYICLFCDGRRPDICLFCRSYMGLFNSDHHRDRDQMPSTSASPYACLVCGNDRADVHCNVCNVARYCSKLCQLKHWRAGHKLECKPGDVDSASAVSSIGIGTTHTDISSSDHHRDRDQMPSTSSSPYKCLFCGNGRAGMCCARCKVARYCSAACQVKHWRAVHRLECKEYKSPANVDTASVVSSERRGASPMGKSSFCPHEDRDRDQMPTSSASPHICFVCSVWANARCSRCKVVRYCSATCQIKHWNEGHKLECKEYKPPTNVDSVPAVSSERRGSGRMGKSSSDHHRDRDQMPSTSASPHICFVCGDWADTHCSGCNVRYCTQKCQIKHWRGGHRLECKEYKSPSYVDSATAVSSESRGSNHVDISSSDNHRDQDQMPSAPSSGDFCFVCGDWSDIRCRRCKVVRYCSQACETKHWREGHKLECKENQSAANVYSTSAVSSERRGPGHIGTSTSEYQQSKKDGKLADTIQSPKSTSSKELPSVEECPICFSTIHTSDPSCPLLACEICKHKFHSTCLLKWFSTSKKSHCPLCQAPFKSEGAAV